MRFLMIAPIVLTIAGYAQDNARPPQEKTAPDQAQPSGQTPVRRLESVTWNPVTGELSWVVSTLDPASTTPNLLPMTPTR